MLRGGSWNNNQRNARVSYRNLDPPEGFPHLSGFGCVWPLSWAVDSWLLLPGCCGLVSGPGDVRDMLGSYLAVQNDPLESRRRRVAGGAKGELGPMRRLICSLCGRPASAKKASHLTVYSRTQMHADFLRSES